MKHLLFSSALAVLFTGSANAADEATCFVYGEAVARLVVNLTNDFDVMQAAQARAEAYCFVLDEPPRLIEERVPTAPVAKVAKVAKSDWAIKCAKAFKSFQESDGTVIRRGAKKRSRCPL
jgi:hypothetical protein